MLQPTLASGPGIYADQVAIHPSAPPALNDLDRALVDRVVTGEVFDLTSGAFADQSVDDTTMRSWGLERTIHATVIRDILLGRLAADPDPHGVRLRGARIEGILDLEDLTSTVAIELTECFLPDGVVARRASLPAATIQRCWLGHPSQPPLIADRLTTPLLVLTQSTVAAHSEDGAVRLEGAHLGQLKADAAAFTNDKGPALFADDLSVDRGVSLTGAFTATGAGKLGAVRLVGIHIGGQLNCPGATLTNMTGPALVADNLNVDGPVFFSDGFKATGAVRLVGAHIGGQLNLTAATLTSPEGPALNADNLNVGQSLLAGFRIVFYCVEGFNATGAGELGAVNLLGARIGGQVNFRAATLTNTTGPALVADNMKVDQALFLQDGFKATGAVRLTGAHIGGQLNFTDATLTNQTGPALFARSLTVGNDLIFAGEFAAQGEGDGEVLDLGMVQIGGSFYFRRDKVSNAANSRALLNIDGLIYVGLPQKGATKDLPAKPATKEWLQLIREGTGSYAAQPYQHLAAALRAAGNDREVRDVLIAQRQDQIGNAETGWTERIWARFTGIMIGYGYKPSRALSYLMCVVILSVALSVALGARGGLAQPNQPAEKPAVQCTTLQQVTFGLDLGTSLFSTNAGCNTTTSATGNGLAVVSWTMRVLAWALATLFIAGFTSAVRKN
jgi:hypothetical protein